MGRNSLTEVEYRFLKGDPISIRRDHYYALGEKCVEDGYIDHFGILTPSGEKAIEEYEQASEGWGGGR